MEELIKVNTSHIGGESVNSVNAREIYKYLDLADGQFARWIKSAIAKYDFEENVDFITLDMEVGATIYKDYIVNMDMAKELCMVSDSVKGRETRKYFINIEKQKAKPLTYEETMQNALLLADKKVKELEYKIQEDRPLVSFATSVQSSINSVLIRDWVKEIGLKEKDVRQWLKDKGYLYKNVQGQWRLSANDTAKKYFEAVATTQSTSKGTFQNQTIKITGEGKTKLTEKILNHFNKNTLNILAKI